MQNKNQKIVRLLTLAVVILATVFFSLTIKAANTEQITINALIFNKGQLALDGTYDVRLALYTTDRVKEDAYPSNKDKDERVWEIVKQLELKDGKLKTELNIPDIKYNRYYLGIRINQDSEMIPRKAVVLGENAFKEEKSLKEEDDLQAQIAQQQKESQIINENFTSQEAVNQTLIEAVNKLQLGTNPGEIPTLNADGKISRSLLDIPAPAGGGGVSTVTLDIVTDTSTILDDVTNNLLNSSTFINQITSGDTFANNVISSFTSNTPSNGEIPVYKSSESKYYSTVLKLELLKDINFSSLNNEDILIYDDSNNEWINKPIADYSTVYTAGTGININSNQISLVDTVDDDTLASLACNNNEIAKWNNGTSQWECAVDTGGVGSATFLGLTDTPVNYAGVVNYLARVNGAGNALEFFDGSAYLDNTDNQTVDTLSLVGTTLNLSLEDDGAANYIVDLASLDTNTTYIAGAGLSLVGGTFNLADTAVTAGSYGNTTQTATFTVDQQGRLTAAGNTTITPAWTSITGRPAGLDDGDDDTTYTAGGTLLNLTGTTFSINEGALTNNRICTYVAGTGLVCNTDPNTLGSTTFLGLSDTPAAYTANHLTRVNAAGDGLEFVAPAALVLGSIDNHSDVDTITTPPTNGQVLAWDNANSEWVPATDAQKTPGGGLGAVQYNDGLGGFTGDEDILSVTAGNVYINAGGVTSFFKVFDDIGNTLFFVDTDADEITINAGQNSGRILVSGNVDNNLFVSDPANDRVGIGTDMPARKLDVMGTGRFTDALTVGAYTLPNTDGANGQVLKTDSVGNLTWQNDTGGVMTFLGLSDTPAAYTTNYLARVNAAGDGLEFVDGTTLYAPAGDYHTQGGNSYGATSILGTNDAESLAFETNNIIRAYFDEPGHFIPNGDNVYNLGSATNRWQDLYLGPASLHIGTDGDEGVLSYNTANDTFNFDHAINLGTTANATAGNLRWTGADFEGYDGTSWVSFTAAGGGGDFANGGELGVADRTLGNTDNFDLSFLTNNENRFHIQNDGNVGIGTTSPSEHFTLAGGNFLQTAITDPITKGSWDPNDLNVMEGAFSVYVSGKYAYVTGGTSDNLAIVDISNPANPTTVGNWDPNDANITDATWAVYVSGKYAYITGRTSDNLAIVDISNPANPTTVGNWDPNDTNITDLTISVYVSGKYAYVSGYNSDNLAIVDISNPSSPTTVGNWDPNDTNVMDGAAAVYVSGKYAYIIGNTSDNLAIVDISNPVSPTTVGNWDPNDVNIIDNANAVYVSGKYAYITGRTSNNLAIVDISNPSSPTTVGNWDPNDANIMNGPHSLYVSGKYAYVSGGNSDNLAIVDISNPSSPTTVGNWDPNDLNIMEAAHSVYVSGKYAYVAGATSDNLIIIDISGIDAPTATIGDLAVGTLDVWENTNIANDLYVGSGLNVGYNALIGGNLTTTGTLTVGAYTLPNTDGANGQVLKTDGLGNLTWQNDGASSTTFVGLPDTPASYTAGSLLFTSGAAVTEDNTNLFWDDTSKRLGIGVNAGLTEAVNINGNINFEAGITAPAAPTVAVNAAAGNLNGDYRYRITFVDSSGHETESGAYSSQVAPLNQQVDLSAIAISGNSEVVARRIYRNDAAVMSFIGPWKYVATINDNVTTTYTDDVADGSLGTDYAPMHNETSGTIYSGNNMVFNAGSTTFVGIDAGSNNGGVEAAGFGYQSLYNNVSAGVAGFGYQSLYNNVGAYSSGFGHSALRDNTGAYSSGFGNGALYNNTGMGSSGFGMAALYNNTGMGSSGFGMSALRDNTGTYSSGFGYQSLQNNTGTASSGFGNSALMYNSGVFSAGFGSNALSYNTGGRSSGFGGNALRNNTGEKSSGFGQTALVNNAGENVSGLGESVLQDNVGDYALGIGNLALNNNIGEHAIGIGRFALRYNQGDNNIAIGRAAFNTFHDDLANAKTFAPADVDTVTNRITVTAHGFGGINDYVNLHITSTGSTPANMGEYPQFKIIDANTIEATDGNQVHDIASQGTGTLTLTPQFVYTNSTALGYDAEPTASNQMMLGNSSLSEVVPGSDGSSNLGSATARWNTIYATNGVINTSDVRLKKNIATLDYGLEELMQINPISFNWKDENSGTDKKLGFSAQELQTIFPEVVRVGEDGSLGVYYSDLMPVAFRAIQELNQKQEEQKVVITSNVLKTDINIQTLTDLQVSVDENLTIINQTLVSLETEINDLATDVNNTQEQLEANTENLAILSEGINSLAELTTILTDTVSNHETRIAQLETLLIDQGIEPDQAIINPQTPGLTNLTESLTTFSDNLIVIQEEDTDEDGNIVPKQIFSLSGDLIVERLKAKKIEAEEIEVAGVITANSLRMATSINEEGLNASSAGNATIIAGQTEVIVRTSSLKDGNSVMVTPTGNVNGIDYYIEKDFENFEFKIIISRALDYEVGFDWFMIETSNDE